MCTGNQAENSQRYLNGQLKLLWENARCCLDKSGDHLSLKSGQTCLVEYNYGTSPAKPRRNQHTQDDFLFSASFAVPELQFLCNHEVILWLRITDGYYYHGNRKDFQRCVVSSSLGYPWSFVDGVFFERRVEIKHFKCAFRLNFVFETIKDVYCESIGNMEWYNLGLHVFNTACK